MKGIFVAAKRPRQLAAAPARGAQSTTELSSKKLTAKKQRLLDAITRYVSHNGYPPTGSELSEATGYPISTVYRHCQGMILTGHLRREDTTGRKFWPTGVK